MKKILIIIILSLAAVLLVGEIIANILDTSFTQYLLKRSGMMSGVRMEKYGTQPPEVMDDLLYLSYIDSLSDHDFKVPDVPINNRNIVRLILDETGISQEIIEKWGISKTGSARELFIELNSQKRLNLPKDGFPLFLEVKEGNVKAGYILFGRRIPHESDNLVDFCAIVTASSKLWPEKTKIIYFNPNGNNGFETKHTLLADIPEIEYFGAGIPGDDIATVFETIVRLVKNR